MTQLAAKRHISSDSEVRKSELHPSASGREDQHLHSLAYSSRYATSSIPKFELPEKSVEPRVAYQLVHDELELDGRPAMNCASFVHTWMEPEADQLITESANKNLADQDEYPATMRIQGCCVSIIGNLWNAEQAVGTPTVGSSEAVMLGGLALKKRWQHARKEAGKDASRPNIILGHNAQVALEKFTRYFDVEPRLIPVSEKSHHVLDIEKAVEACDANTIGVFIILGSTYTGHFEDVKGLSKLLDELQEKTGLDIPIHVDAASGGFVAPFAFPGLEWDFRLPRVVSINASGHKFGLCYPGIGWILWKSDEYLPKDLVFELHYLGGTEYSFGLNFSRPACFMIGQYYNFIRLGYEGYTKIIENCLSNARILSNALERSGYFDCISDMHREDGVFGYEEVSAKQQAENRKKKGEDVNYNPSLPVVSFKFTDDFKRRYPHVRQSAVSMLIRTKGWIVPNYSLPPDEEEVEILRVVVRESLSVDMVDRLIKDIMEAVNKLRKLENTVDEAVFAPLEEISDHTKGNKSKDSDTTKPKTYARTC